MGRELTFEEFKRRLLRMDLVRRKLFEATARRWTIAGHTRDQEFWAEIFWHSTSYKPRLIIRRSDGGPGEVGVNELSHAGHSKYMALYDAVQEWRRGKAMLPEGDVPFDLSTSEESTS